MKYVYPVVYIIFLCNASAFSQTPLSNNSGIADSLPKKLLRPAPKFFINIHSGYAVALGTTFKFYPDDIVSVKVEKLNNNAPVTTTQYKAASKGLGEGFRYGGGISYILNDFINLGFEFDYFKSTTSKTRDSSFHRSVTNTTTNETLSEYIYKQQYTISYSATLLTFSPNITFKAISRPKFYIYNKLGAVITYRPNSIQKDIVQESMQTLNNTSAADSSSSAYSRYEWGIKKPAFGFMGAVGAQFKISDKIRGFAEIQFSHMVFAVKNRVQTDFKIDNNNLINTLPENVKVIEFRNSYSADQQNTNPNTPSISTVQRIPVTYLGLQAGFAYRF